MRIKTVAILMTQEDHDKIQIASDLKERKERVPRGRGSMKDFILEAALSQAELLIAENNKATGRDKQ
jgi:uncharacterized protein (DUF1778 family)